MNGNLGGNIVSKIAAKVARLHSDASIVARSLPQAAIPQNTIKFYREILTEAREDDQIAATLRGFPDVTEQTQYRDFLVMVGQLLVILS